MTLFCPNCGKQMNDDAKFCMDCGKNLVNYTQSGADINNNVIQRSQVGAPNTGNITISPVVSNTITSSKSSSFKKSPFGICHKCGYDLEVIRGVPDEFGFPYKDNNFIARAKLTHAYGYKCFKCGYKYLVKIESHFWLRCKCGCMENWERLRTSSFFGGSSLKGYKCKDCKKIIYTEDFPDAYHRYNQKIIGDGIKNELEKLGWDLSNLETFKY